MEAIDQKYIISLSIVISTTVADPIKYGHSTIVDRLELCRPHTFNA